MITGDPTSLRSTDSSSTVISNVPVLAGPQAPTSVTATPGHGSATVSWTAPASLDGGTLTGYTATASPDGNTCTTTGATSCTITGLTGGTTYIVTVVAHTTAGDSGASAPATVTPATSQVAFTSNGSDMATASKAFTFTEATTGAPTPKITETGPLPKGVKFTGHSGGTATLSGTPAKAAAGAYPLTLTTASPAETDRRTFTLRVTLRWPVGWPISADEVQGPTSEIRSTVMWVMNPDRLGFGRITGQKRTRPRQPG